MVKQTLSIGGRLLLAAVFFWAAIPASGEVNRIVLRVNDNIATLRDYEKLKNERIGMLARSEMSQEERQRQLASAGIDTMRNLFQEMLLLSRADQLDVRIGPSELQEALEGTKQSFGINTDEEFEDALRQSGLTRDGLRKQIEKSLRIREVLGREVYSEVVVEDEDLRRYYSAHPEEFRTQAAILLREVIALESSGLEDQALLDLAVEVRQTIVDGTSDATLQETESQGRTTGWIDLGWVESGDLDDQLEAGIAGLQAGEVSEPIAARGGLHLLQVIERRDARVRDFAEVRDQLLQSERGRRIEKRQVEYLRDLEAQAFIVANPPPEAAGFRAELANESDLIEGAPSLDSAAAPGQ